MVNKLEMKLKIYQIDAFTDTVFKGNPAAVCPLNEWIADEKLLKIAAENNLAETAFYIPKGDTFEIRWFTPTTEVDLCGHATLAAAFAISKCEGYTGSTINFVSPRSGALPVTVQNSLFSLNFPVDTFVETELKEELINTTSHKPIAAYKGKTDYMLVYKTEEDISALKPNLSLIASLNARGIIVTAAGKEHDFVSRFFAPAVGIIEDAVCGSAHTTLTPYWAKVLGKTELSAFQLSERTGIVKCKLLGDRVELGGNAALYLTGEINIG